MRIPDGDDVECSGHNALIREARAIAKLLQSERRAAWADVLDCYVDEEAVCNQLEIDDIYQRAKAFLKKTEG